MPRTSNAVALLNNLGSWSRHVSAAVPRAQDYFNQGLRLYYGFNHAESVRAFREAQRLDPGCVMCVWGEAAALGPNMNAPMDTASERQAIAATERALALLHSPKTSNRVKTRDGAWIQAIAARYLGGASRAERDSSYAAAMAAIADKNPNDADALAIAAEAAMDLSPWAYWAKDGTPKPGTQRLVAWLEQGMRVAESHPGACHFYIHAVEAAHPERAVRCAERLAALMPGAGHIVHMPAHIYIRVGRWADAIAMNKHAVHADEKYFDGPHTPDAGFYAAAYQSHNFHFLTLAAVMAGSSTTAVSASQKVVGIVTPAIARVAPPLEALLAVPVQTLVTFGRWEEVLKTPLPPADLRVALGHFWYARGMAFAATGRLAEARATIDSIQSVSAKMPAGEQRMTMDIAARMVEGEIAFSGKQFDRAVKALSEAVEIEDGLSYMEPPTWYHPVRHSLGRALLAADRAREAEQVYLADLRRFPENGWSLRGLSLALAAQGNVEGAKAIEKRFRKAWRLSDVAITASRF
ncbi:MAG: hypothetical protein H7Z40_22940 [Phycisphaerae bacterium]|nr:hypothetical protein [Gemmatimonadaceae bacterium]